MITVGEGLRGEDFSAVLVSHLVIYGFEKDR